jgi:hypothetical protein
MKDVFERIGFWTASLVTLLMLALAAPANAVDDDRSGTFLTPSLPKDCSVVLCKPSTATSA